MYKITCASYESLLIVDIFFGVCSGENDEFIFIDFGSTSHCDASGTFSRAFATIFATGRGLTRPFGRGRVPPPVAP
jgi:hypothetical protein